MIEDVNRKYNSFFFGGLLASVGFLFSFNIWWVSSLAFVFLWFVFSMLLSVGIRVGTKVVNKREKKSWKKINR